MSGQVFDTIVGKNSDDIEKSVNHLVLVLRTGSLKDDVYSEKIRMRLGRMKIARTAR